MLLHRLFGEVVLPAQVLKECLHSGAPEPLRSWAGTLPPWAKVAETPHPLPDSVTRLDAGEAAAIGIALHAPKPVLRLMDERAGVTMARQLGLPFTGTMGLLVRGHQLGMLDFEKTVTRLRGTRFRFTEALIAKARGLLD